VLFENLCVDFEAAWDAMATTDLVERTDGAFLFARQAMLLVELASTVAGQDPATFRRFSVELQRREPLLFKRIPYRPGRATRGNVPRIASEGDPAAELITLIFDLVRHGHAHFGHQLYAPLKGGRGLGIVLIGVRKGRTVDRIRPSGGRILEHLSCTRQANGDLVLRLCPGTLFLDVRDASESADVWKLDADASHYTAARTQQITADELEAALADRGPYMLVFKSRDGRPDAQPARAT